MTSHVQKYSDRALCGEAPEAVLVADQDEFEIDEDWVLYDVVAPHIARITINRPERRNAILSPDMHELFEERLRRAENDDDMKVVLLTGAGSDFCAGDDVRRLPVEKAGLKKGSKLPQTARHRERAASPSPSDELARVPEDGDRRLPGKHAGGGTQPRACSRSGHRRRRRDVRPPAGTHRVCGIQHRDAPRPVEVGRQSWIRGHDHRADNHRRRDARVGRRVVDRSGRRSGRGIDALCARRSLTTRPTGS